MIARRANLRGPATTAGRPLARRISILSLSFSVCAVAFASLLSSSVTLAAAPIGTSNPSSPARPSSASDGRAVRDLAKWDDEQVVQVRRRAEQGDAMAQVEMGLMYFAGNKVPQNFSEAESWWKRAADQQNAVAELNLGVMHQNGVGVPKDEAEAVRWYRRAAEHGDDTAQFRLAQAYYSGTGALMDFVLAAEWYRKAAEQGNVLAQLTLGFLYRAGEGVMRDLELAIEWWRRAAEQGNANAQFDLAMAYRDGDGVMQNIIEAYTWAALAAENSSGESRQRYARLRDELTMQLTPEALSEAQTRLRALHDRLRRKL
jgi:TPR repeat protein